ncbi:hypothetical protein AA958_11110 [Streptomyces sp. CNQ-509]|uniref:hypothetical protein n=1 Tax=Streptomyces sp. CNQ-509 TaxID=444103 RepID=UPI00062DEEDC|nr:hypothetical protein [Streptomyces sp. CNQ-509]AKH82689.1 hypothetical protein AA958_11110 [Streptomyces sp. CNQ-509]
MTDYTGSGPYCYANSLVMSLPDAVAGPAPSPALVETLTGSPFGVQLLGGTVPLFDPYGWDPEIGLDDAVALLGFRCDRTSGGSADEAMARLRTACARGPVLVGPVDMGLLLYHPGTPWSPSAGGNDHYVVALAADGDTVLLHDPHGHPYATLPAGEFLASWRAEAVEYTAEPYVMRAGFERVRTVTAEEAVRAALPGAVAWLAVRTDLPVPPGTVGGAEALERLADRAAAGLDAGVRELLADFAVRVGARRLADASAYVRRAGLDRAAAVLQEQARLVGAVQYPLVRGDGAALAAVLRRLAPTYGRLREVLAAG